MTYQQFNSEILNTFQNKFQENGTTIQIKQVTKNNSVSLDGLFLMKEGSNITPTIYLNDYYKDFCQHHNFEQTIMDILSVYEQNNEIKQIDLTFFTDFEKVCNHLAYKLINYEKNQALLNEIPHIRYLDLAIVYYYVFDNPATHNATILIHNSHLELWDITPQLLHAYAKKNTPVLFPYDLRSLNDIMEELIQGNSFLPKDEQDFLSDEPPALPMYVLTNRSRLFGASCILYPDALLTLSSQMACDFYIIPSSIHEVILIPSRSQISIAELNQMVQDVNATQLDAEEILSDHIYYYSAKKMRLSM